MPKQTEENWLESQGYLPAFMRDFHEQKSIFKWIWRAVERNKERNPSVAGNLGNLTWSAAHVYVIDFFLWFMARHGYTLQPSRKPWPAADWGATIKQMKDEDAEAFRKMLDERAAQKASEAER